MEGSDSCFPSVTVIIPVLCNAFVKSIQAGSPVAQLIATKRVEWLCAAQLHPPRPTTVQ